MGTHLRLWFIACLVAVIVLPMLVPAADIADRVNSEVGMVSRVFGEDDARKIVDATNATYKSVFVDSGLIRTMDRTYVTEAQQVKDEPVFGSMGRVFSAGSNRYLLAFAANGYAFLLRARIVAIWSPYIVPFLLAAALDGFMRKRIKMVSFGYISPVLFSWSAHILIVACFGVVFYLIVPFAIHPLFMPAWAVGLALPLAGVVANSQRVTG